ncbi:response regulator [Aliarcobacter lanthieri]|uniref:response regulator n=1 Tax=Aliarcobacter lanthieri TaxID=1355374 RepID=UPI003AAE48E3
MNLKNIKIKNLLLSILAITFFIIILVISDIFYNHNNNFSIKSTIFLFVVLVLSFISLIIFNILFKQIIYHQKRIEKILNSQRNILIVTDGQNIIQSNKAFLNFFKINSLEEFNKNKLPIYDYFIEEVGFLKNDCNWLEYILKNNTNSNLIKINQDNNEYTFKVFAHKIEDSIYFEAVVTFEDITNELKIESELIKQRNIITESNNTKSQFLANISHELRTPMNAIIGFTKLFFDTKLDSKQYNLLMRIDDSSRLLLNTIEDMLYITQIESKEFKLENKEFRLNELIQYVETTFFKESLKQNNKFILNVEENIPKKILVDKIKLLQVISNFLTNAFKFTTNGEVSLNIELIKRIDPNKAKIRFSVIDTGIGIKKSFQDEIFNQFVQEDNSNNRQFKGSGLGLTICKKIIELFNSKIELESEINKGSKFSFTIIVETLDETLEIENAYPYFDNLTILLVEDNVINQEVASLILKKSNINVDIASNGKEAIEIFEKHKSKYDLILMDLQMPILNGFEATKQIRKIDANIPIIALTASNLIMDRQKALDVLMNDFLLKPIDTDSLYKTIIKYVKKLKNCEIKYIKNNLEVTNNILNKRALECSIENKELMNKLLKKFLEQLNNEFNNIVDEVSNNSQNAKSLVHGLKGVSGNLGAISLFEICKKIDEKYKQNIHISKEDIKILENEIEDIKKELEFLDNEIFEQLEQDNNSILNDDEFKKLLSSIIQDLEEGNIIDDEKLLFLYKNLYNKTDDINLLKTYIDDFEYNLAIEFLKDLK